MKTFMKNFRYSSIVMLALVALMLLTGGEAQAQKRNAKRKAQAEQQLTTGAEDRAKWVEWLWKISYPVVHNLAENTLRKNMPVEWSTGEKNPERWYREVTHLEAVGRTLAGLAPWLALPDDDTQEGKLRKQMREEVLRGLRNGVDPESPDLLNFTRELQPIVDAADVVYACMRGPWDLWGPVDVVG